MRVAELWRYPVKSMLGEHLESATIDPGGITGDREYAVLDADTGVSLSAKRYSALLSCRAETLRDGVAIVFPDGTSLPARSPAAAERLSGLLDRPVYVGSVGDVGAVRHEFAVDSATGHGGAKLVESSLSGFADGAPVHLLSLSTLSELSRLAPGSRFEVARFRPNIVVESPQGGFVEHGWVGESLMIGDVAFDVLDHKTRCVVTTRPQGALPQDREVLRAVALHNENRAGVALAALRRGTIGTGDGVMVT